MDDSKLSPIIKWAGGKEKELKHIIPNLPTRFRNYYEPFVGGGAVFTAIKADRYFINDKSEELIGLYRIIAGGDRELFFGILDLVVDNWDTLTQIVTDNQAFFIDIYGRFSADGISEIELKTALFRFITEHSDELKALFSGAFEIDTDNFIKEIKSNLLRKVKRMKELEGQKGKLPDGDIMDNVETAFKSAFYMHMRHLYNDKTLYRTGDALGSALFLFIRNFAYSGMFRYNANGEFNVPYGGIGYNRKNLRKKIDYLRSEELKERLDNTVIENLDFEEFLRRHKPGKNDFIFLDPPYDTEFSTYAGNDFTKEDQQRLANCLRNECKAQWMMVIKNTDYIHSLYEGVDMQMFDKTYLVSFMNRNDKAAEHLVIRRISEAELIIPSLYLMSKNGGSIRTSELLKELRVIMRPEGEDLAILSGRNDDKFSQKVRNLRAHSTFERYELAKYSGDSRNGEVTITNSGKKFLEKNQEIVEYLLNSDFSYLDTMNSLQEVASNQQRGKIEAFDENMIAREGAKTAVENSAYTRCTALRDYAVKHYATEGKIRCHCCNFSFNEFYGSELGHDFIEIHHIKPIFKYEDANMEATFAEAVKNLIPVCSNCHRMIHRKRMRPLEIEELKAGIEANGIFKR